MNSIKYHEVIPSVTTKLSIVPMISWILNSIASVATLFVIPLRFPPHFRFSKQFLGLKPELLRLTQENSFWINQQGLIQYY